MDLDARRPAIVRKERSAPLLESVNTAFAMLVGNLPRQAKPTATNVRDVLSF